LADGPEPFTSRRVVLRCGVGFLCLFVAIIRGLFDRCHRKDVAI